MQRQELAASGQPAMSEDELRTLELRWYEGRMLPLAERLLEFVGRHREEIVCGATTRTDPAALLVATKQFIRQRGTMHMQSEVTDQIREIQNELWYCGERGDHDRSRIKDEWTAKHAPAWRRWRINEYLFVADKSAEEIARTLAAAK